MLLSIIIPTYNEENFIHLCLDSIFSSTLSKSDYEVIVVDNGSTDKTVEIACKFIDAQVIIAKNCNVGAVRNAGARAAKGEYLIFLDGDCTIEKDWLRKKIHLINVFPDTILGGGILLPRSPTWVERFWTLQCGNSSHLPKKLIGASILIPLYIFIDLNGFNEGITSGEDSDFHDKILKRCINIKMTNEMDVTHLGNAKTLLAFAKRQMWHSENYLKNMKASAKDPIFWATILSIFFIASLIFSLATNEKFPLTELIGLFTISSMLSIKRVYRSKGYNLKLKHTPMILTLDFLYITARSIGIFFSVVRILVNR